MSSKHYWLPFLLSTLWLFGIALCFAVNAMAQDRGYGFSAKTKQELFERQLLLEWEQAEAWPDLVVLYQGRSQAFDGEGFDYLVLEVNDHSLCWDSTVGRLRENQLLAVDKVERPARSCMVTSIQRIEVAEALPLNNGGYTRTRLVSLPEFGMVMMMSTAEVVKWVVVQDSPLPLSSMDVVESASVVSSRHVANIELMELNFNFSRNFPVEAIPLIEVFSGG